MKKLGAQMPACLIGVEATDVYRPSPLAKELVPVEMRFNDDAVSVFGHQYPRYTFHFKPASGCLRIRTRRAP